jgi:hypothetical protein
MTDANQRFVYGPYSRLAYGRDRYYPAFTRVLPRTPVSGLAPPRQQWRLDRVVVFGDFGNRPGLIDRLEILTPIDSPPRYQRASRPYIFRSYIPPTSLEMYKRKAHV